MQNINYLYLENACLASVITVNFTHPIELIKTRTQLDKFCANNIIKNEGFFHFGKVSKYLGVGKHLTQI